MLTDRQLDRILEASPISSGVSDPVEAILNEVKSCPICSELFSRSDELKEHLENDHADDLVSSGSKQIQEHCVEEGDDKIYICPHCRFAAGENSRVYGRGSTAIIRHVEKCPYNLSARYGPARVSFDISHDLKLIGDYLHDCAEIELFPCFQCNRAFGSAGTLAVHLALDHSSPCSEDLTEEQMQRIRSATQRVVNTRVTPKPITSVVAAQNTTGGIEGPPTWEDKHKPPQIRERQQKIEYSPTSLPGNAVPIGKDFSRTVKQREILGGYVVLPPRLSACLGPATQVKVDLASDKNGTALSFDPSDRRLGNLTDWFRKSAIEPGDKVKFRLLGVEPPEIRVWTEWEKHLNYILRCPAEDFKWEQLPIRDCLIKVFAVQQGPVHYRSLCAGISRHRDLRVGSVNATLSRYRGVLFEHSGHGMWTLLEDAARTGGGVSPSTRTGQGSSPGEVSDAVWEIVAEIEEADAVYRLLKRTHDSLSFIQICQEIAEARGIDWHELQHTGFLNAEDERLRRLDNGHFALREWFDDPLSAAVTSPREADDARDGEPIAPTIVTPVDSPASPTVPEGPLSKLWAVIRQIVRFVMHWVQRRSHD